MRSFDDDDDDEDDDEDVAGWFFDDDFSVLDGPTIVMIHQDFHLLRISHRIQKKNCNRIL